MEELFVLGKPCTPRYLEKNYRRSFHNCVNLNAKILQNHTTRGHNYQRSCCSKVWNAHGIHVMDRNLLSNSTTLAVVLM